MLASGSVWYIYSTFVALVSQLFTCAVLLGEVTVRTLVTSSSAILTDARIDRTYSCVCGSLLVTLKRDSAAAVSRFSRSLSAREDLLIGS